jgi:hypothetical protein
MFDRLLPMNLPVASCGESDNLKAAMNLKIQSTSIRGRKRLIYKTPQTRQSPYRHKHLFLMLRRILFFCTLRADIMGEVRVRMVFHVYLHLLPVSFIITYLFACRANRE